MFTSFCTGNTVVIVDLEAILLQVVQNCVDVFEVFLLGVREYEDIVDVASTEG